MSGLVLKVVLGDLSWVGRVGLAAYASQFNGKLSLGMVLHEKFGNYDWVFFFFVCHDPFDNFENL